MPESMQACRLDPSVIRASRWANRQESSFLTADFEAFKAEIAQAGGNVQPAKVRALIGGGFEIVFGHRRHRACLELGVPLLAIVVSLDDRSLWEEMDRENRLRVNLSAVEQGLHYLSALDAGLYPSIRRMAEAVGVDISQASKVIRLARLPKEVIAAFKSPSDIQVNWATALQGAHQRNPRALISRAVRIGNSTAPRQGPKAIFLALTEDEGVERFHARTVSIADATRGRSAVIKQRKSGFSVEIKGADLPLPYLEAALRKLLGS